MKTNEKRLSDCQAEESKATGLELLFQRGLKADCPICGSNNTQLKASYGGECSRSGKRLPFIATYECWECESFPKFHIGLDANATFYELLKIGGRLTDNLLESWKKQKGVK